MSRVTIMYENALYPEGRIFAPGSVSVEQPQIPVSWGFRWDDPGFGWAKDFERNEETGELTMDLVLDSGEEIDEHYFDVGIYSKDFDVETSDDIQVIARAVVRGLGIVALGFYADVHSAEQ